MRRKKRSRIISHARVVDNLRGRSTPGAGQQILENMDGICEEAKKIGGSIKKALPSHPKVLWHGIRIKSLPVSK